MAEHETAEEAAAGAETGARGTIPDVVSAVTLALGAKRRKSQVDDQLIDVLHKQGRMLDLQMEHLHEERELAHKHQSLKFFGDRLKVALQVLTFLVGGALAIGAAVVVWTDAHADGLVIKPFSVPPSLAARGLTGEAVATAVIDHWSTMAQAGRTMEAERRLSADQGDGLKIEIPETGLSLGQIDTWLKARLGHERQVTGEVVDDGEGGFTVAARSGDTPVAEQHGAAKDLPQLLEKTAEALFGAEQPTTYFSYLQRGGRIGDARDFETARTHAVDPQDRAVAFSGLAVLAPNLVDRRNLWIKSVAIDPKASSIALGDLGDAEGSLGHDERAYALLRQQLTELKDPSNFPTLAKDVRSQYIATVSGVFAAVTNDWNNALASALKFAGSDMRGYSEGETGEVPAAMSFAALHDLPAARQELATVHPDNDAGRLLESSGALHVAVSAEDWVGAWQAWQTWKTLQAMTEDPAHYVVLGGEEASILVHLGRLDEAQAIVSSLPLDCVDCVVAMGELAAVRGDKATADHWLSEAVRMEPSLSFAPYRWGQVLLTRGDMGSAIREFAAANQHGPKWADPLSGWGEALLAQGDAGGAAAKFAAASKLAPNWGRNEMLWGEALNRQDKADRARSHWGRAQALYLTPAEQARLAGDLKTV